MIILSIDTSSKAATAALMSDETLICEYTISNKKTHSQNILPMISDMLEKSDISMDDIDAFAVCTGPGSFTGLRIGMATAKTFAQVKDKPIIGVSALHGLYKNVCPTPYLVCPIIDARHDDVYNALFKDDKRLTEDRAININELLKELKGQKVFFVGDGVSVHKELICNEMGEDAVFAPVSKMESRASSICVIAFEKARNNEYDNPYTLNPVYLRVSQAEREYALNHKE